MRRKNNTPVKSSTKKKVVVSAAAAYDYDDDDDDYENLSPYCEPVRMYHTLHVRSLCNPSFLRRSVNYNIADKRKKKSGVNKRILFDYLHCRNKTLQLTEFTETCTCPFCSMQCVTFKVLELHLNTSHDLFEYEFKFLKAYVKVGVYVKDGEELEDEEEDINEPFSFCSKPRIRRGSNNNSLDNHQTSDSDDHMDDVDADSEDLSN